MTKANGKRALSNGIVPARTQEATKAPRRLIGDHLYTWAQLVGEARQAMQRLNAFAAEVGPQYQQKPGETLNDLGYFVPIEQADPSARLDQFRKEAAAEQAQQSMTTKN